MYTCSRTRIAHMSGFSQDTPGTSLRRPLGSRSSQARRPGNDQENGRATRGSLFAEPQRISGLRAGGAALALVAKRLPKASLRTSRPKAANPPHKLQLRCSLPFEPIKVKNRSFRAKSTSWVNTNDCAAWCKQATPTANKLSPTCSQYAPNFRHRRKIWEQNPPNPLKRLVGAQGLEPWTR